MAGRRGRVASWVFTVLLRCFPWDQGTEKYAQ